MIRFLLLAGLFAILNSCGPSADLSKARSLEKRGYYVEASLKYDKFIKNHPGDKRCAEALYRMGRIYQKKLKICSHAQRYFLKTAEQFPGVEPWSGLAKKDILNCPDYHPLTEGTFWIEGDSQTGGKNMRAEWTCKEVSSGTFRITRKFSAGSKQVMSVERFFRKENMEFREYSAPQAKDYTLLYAYPLETGKEWRTSRDGREIKYKILGKDAVVKVKAGEFGNCIKISEEYPSLSGSKKYNYYAPDIGWVLTTTSASGGQEFRNTELISYKIMPEKDNDK